MWFIPSLKITLQEENLITSCIPIIHATTRKPIQHMRLIIFRLHTHSLVTCLTTDSLLKTLNDFSSSVSFIKSMSKVISALKLCKTFSNYLLIWKTMTTISLNRELVCYQLVHSDQKLHLSFLLHCA